VGVDRALAFSFFWILVEKSPGFGWGFFL